MEKDHPILDKFKLSGTFLFKCSVDFLFENYFSDNATMPFI
jgi:hypothetical protein